MEYQKKLDEDIFHKNNFMQYKCTKYTKLTWTAMDILLKSWFFLFYYSVSYSAFIEIQKESKNSELSQSNLKFTEHLEIL
jgi:hypothetical protein